MIVELGQKPVTWLGPVPLKSGFHTQAGCAAAIGRGPDQAGSNLPWTERGQPERNLRFYVLSRLPLFLWQKWSFVLFLIAFPAFKQSPLTAYPVTAMPGTWNNSPCMGVAIPWARQGAMALLPSVVWGHRLPTVPGRLFFHHKSFLNSSPREKELILHRHTSQVHYRTEKKLNFFSH